MLSYLLAFALFVPSLASPILARAQQPSASTAIADPKIEAKAREWLHRLQTGDIDSSQLTDAVKAQMTPALVKQATGQLGPLGDPASFAFVGQQAGQGYTVYEFAVTFKTANLNEFLAIDTAGKIAGINFKPRQDAGDIQKLNFLAGSWQCTIKGGPSNGQRMKIQYSFSQDGLWMTESQNDSGAANGTSMTQVWGYDSRQQKLVAYQFLKEGLFTKTVDGWVDGKFVSHRDENGWTVSLVPQGANAMQWVIESADHSYTVSEDCGK